MTARATDRVPRLVWIGVLLAAVYVLMAAGFSTLLEVWFAPETTTADFALTHLVPLPIIIAAGLWFAYRSGWWSDIWSETPTYRQRPRRLWLVVIPVGIVVQIVLLATDVPWADRTLGLILIVLAGTFLVGFGEEFFFRGILVTTLRARHGEFVTMLVSSVLFGLAHVLGAAIAGLEPAAILFQVTFLSMEGALFYAVRRVTGTLWAAIVLHALGDFFRYLVAASPDKYAVQPDPSTAGVVVEVVLIASAAVLLVSIARENLAARKHERAHVTGAPR